MTNMEYGRVVLSCAVEKRQMWLNAVDLNISHVDILLITYNVVGCWVVACFYKSLPSMRIHEHPFIDVINCMFSKGESVWTEANLWFSVFGYTNKTDLSESVRLWSSH